MSFEQSKYFITFDEYNKLADEITKDEYDKLLFNNKTCYGSIQTITVRGMDFMYYKKEKFNNPEKLKQYLLQLIENNNHKIRCEYYKLPPNCTKKDIEEKETEEKSMENIEIREKRQIAQFIDIMHNKHSDNDFDLLLKSSSEDIADKLIKDLDIFFNKYIIKRHTKEDIGKYLNWNTINPTHKSFELEIDLDFLIHFKTLKHRGYDCIGYETHFGPDAPANGIVTLYSDINEILDILCMHLLETEDDNIHKMLFLYRYFNKHYPTVYTVDLFIDTLDRLIKDKYINLFNEDSNGYKDFCRRDTSVKHFSINNKIIEQYTNYYQSGDSVREILMSADQEIEDDYKAEYTMNEILIKRNQVAEESEKKAGESEKKAGENKDKKKYLKYKQKYLNLKNQRF